MSLRGFGNEDDKFMGFLGKLGRVEEVVCWNKEDNLPAAAKAEEEVEEEALQTI